MNWFKQLSDSEKKLVKYGSVIIVFAVLWAYVYKPITHSISLKSKQMTSLNKQFEEMQASQVQFKVNKQKATSFHRDESKPFITWIDEQLIKNTLSQFVARSEPKDNKTLILNFESIVFDDLIQWLQTIDQNYNITIAEVDVNLIDRNNGLCNARITLEEQ